MPPIFRAPSSPTTSIASRDRRPGGNPRRRTRGLTDLVSLPQPPATRMELLLASIAELEFDDWLAKSQGS